MTLDRLTEAAARETRGRAVVPDRLKLSDEARETIALEKRAWTEAAIRAGEIKVSALTAETGPQGHAGEAEG